MIRALAIAALVAAVGCSHDETANCGGCPEGGVCRDGACRWPCVTPADCPASLNRCWDGVCLDSDDECEADSHCADPAPCETPIGATCTGAVCVYPPAAAGRPCDDGDRCTTGDGCDGTGTCVGEAVVCDQPEADACVTEGTEEWFITHVLPGACRPEDGTCAYQEVRIRCPGCAANCLGVCDGVSCPPLAGGCVTDGYCDPSSGSCAYMELDDGEACDLSESGDGYCLDAVCAACALDSHRDDGNVCTANTCAAGTCEAANLDGDECGERFCLGLELHAQTCASGVCAGDTMLTDCDKAEVDQLDSCDPAQGCSSLSSMLDNPLFENGTVGWWIGFEGTPDIDFDLGPGWDGTAGARVTFNATNGSDNMQLSQNNINLAPHTDLILAFPVRSTGGADLELALMENDPPNTWYGLNFARVDVRESWAWRYFRFTSENNASTVDARIVFWFVPYAQAGVVYHLDNVILTPASSVQSLAMVNLLANPGCEDGVSEWGSAATLDTSSSSHSGTASCLITNRADTSDGMEQELTDVLQDGTTYDVSARVRVSAASALVNVTLAVDDGGGLRYLPASAQTTVTSTGWTEVRGSFTLTLQGQASELRLYLEGPDAGVDINADDFVLSPRL